MCREKNLNTGLSRSKSSAFFPWCDVISQRLFRASIPLSNDDDEDGKYLRQKGADQRGSGGAAMRYCRVSCPKQNLEPRLSDASPTPHPTKAQGEQPQAGLPVRTGVTLGNKEAVCLFSSLPGDRTCQPPRRRMENQGAHPPPPRTELCGRAQAWRRPQRTTSWGPGEQPGVRPPQRPLAGDGRLGGCEEEAPEKGLQVCGQLMNAVSRSCLAGCRLGSVWRQEGGLHQKPGAPA